MKLIFQKGSNYFYQFLAKKKIVYYQLILLNLNGFIFLSNKVWKIARIVRKNNHNYYNII